MILAPLLFKFYEWWVTPLHQLFKLKECSFSYTYTVCVIGNTLCIIVLLNSLLNLKVIVKVGCLNTYCTINLRNKLNNSFFIHFSTTLLSLYYVIMTSGLFPFLPSFLGRAPLDFKYILWSWLHSVTVTYYVSSAHHIKQIEIFDKSY